MITKEAILKKFFKKVAKKMEAKGISRREGEFASKTCYHFETEDEKTLRKVGKKVANKLKEKYPDDVEIYIDSDKDVRVNGTYLITNCCLYSE